MSSKKDYTKEIIEEYNVRLQSWGDSDSWGLTEFKMLEDLIYESSKMRINANTLKRFFQQRTSNPQVATNNALCTFLGYTSYTDFVMKKTKQEKKQETDVQQKEINVVERKNEEFVSKNNITGEIIEKNETEFSASRKETRKSIVFAKYFLAAGIVIVLIAAALNWNKFGELHKNYLISKIIFTSSETSGACPLTVKFEYKVPPQLFDSIYVEFREPNGDITRKKLNKDLSETYMTYIYSGKGSCELKYGKKNIKTIYIETRTPGWSAYVRDDQIDFYSTIPFEDVINNKGYISLPKEKIPKIADTEKLFVSYTYYFQNLVDGDNFIYEARVRNSSQDYGIPCYDVMMYAFSDSLFHCFSMNKSCYSYLKFVSSENAIMGENQDLSRFKFNPACWNVMRIEVVNKQTTFYLDNEAVLKMNYKKPLGRINELTLRFKGCGAVDHVKIMDLKHKVIYENSFDSVSE